ncbi:MAG TPA: 3-oxoadipate enol-lactonase [Candidatus Acidoferrum sp.]|nr:3-oxoadipate enol-lactonase [Candidatus Acidoferrum sp.]
MPFAELKDVRINYELSGPSNAPAVVFSNSLGQTLAMWDEQAAEFAKQFRVLRYDTRGHGRSSVTAGPYSIELLAHDVLGLLDSLQLQRVHFCGLSMGGQTGMWLGLNAPQRLQKLILCNTAAKIGNSEMWNARIHAVRTSGLSSVSDAIVGRWFSEQFRAKSGAFIAATKKMIEQSNPEGYVANCVAVGDYDVRNSLGAVQVPTLVIAGTHDAATTPEDGRYIAQQIRGAKYVELDAAHLSNIEQPQQFNEAAMNFLLS